MAQVLPGRVPDPADDHARGRRLHVPDDDRHLERSPRAPVGPARAAQLRLGHRPVAGPDGRDHQRHVAVDAVRVHRPARPSRASSRGPRGGPRRRRSRWRSFLRITMPALLPVSTTIVLIRLIEGFKIIDMPNILLGGRPGPATQSMTLRLDIDWNTLNLGRSAAVASPPADPGHGRGHGLRELRAPEGDDGRMTNPFRRRSTSDLSPLAKFGAFLLLLGWTFVVLFPIYWLFVTSFKTPYQVRQGPVLHPVRGLHPDARRVALHPGRARERHAPAVREHGDRGPVEPVIALILGSVTAYALVRFTYRRRSR